MQSMTRASLHKFGYELEPIHFDLFERFAYILWHWPANFLRMIAWLGIEYVQHNFPQTLGRKPASKMIIKNAKV
jgi:hypothetical protein